MTYREVHELEINTTDLDELQLAELLDALAIDDYPDLDLGEIEELEIELDA